jgi:hypothetical protein
LDDGGCGLGISSETPSAANSEPWTFLYDREATIKRPLLNKWMEIDEESRQQAYDKLQSDPERLMLDLVDLVTGSIEPDSWNINGGRGSIIPNRGRLIVYNSMLVHVKLGEALGDSASLEK